MNKYSSCPISNYKIDRRIVRINSGITMVALAAAGYTQSIIPLVLLSVDVFFRTTSFANFSIIKFVSQQIIRYFPVGDYKVNAGPKIFATKLCLVLICLIILSYGLSLTITTYIIGTILFICSGLEAVLGYCVVCKVYPILQSK